MLPREVIRTPRARAVVLKEVVMLPPKKEGTGSVGFNIRIRERTVALLDEIVEHEKVKSRNSLIDTWLAFAAELFQLQKPFAKQIDEFKHRESERTGAPLSDAQAIALLVERGLRTSKK